MAAAAVQDIGGGRRNEEGGMRKEEEEGGGGRRKEAARCQRVPLRDGRCCYENFLIPRKRLYSPKPPMALGDATSRKSEALPRRFPEL
jgi:hypothetical protein